MNFTYPHHLQPSSEISRASSRVLEEVQGLLVLRDKLPRRCPPLLSAASLSWVGPSLPPKPIIAIPGSSAWQLRPPHLAWLSLSASISPSLSFHFRHPFSKVITSNGVLQLARGAPGTAPGKADTRGSETQPFSVGLLDKTDPSDGS